MPSELSVVFPRHPGKKLRLQIASQELHRATSQSYRTLGFHSSVKSHVYLSAKIALQLSVHRGSIGASIKNCSFGVFFSKLPISISHHFKIIDPVLSAVREFFLSIPGIPSLLNLFPSLSHHFALGSRFPHFGHCTTPRVTCACSSRHSHPQKSHVFMIGAPRFPSDSGMI